MDVCLLKCEQARTDSKTVVLKELGITAGYNRTNNDVNVFDVATGKLYRLPRAPERYIGQY